MAPFHLLDNWLGLVVGNFAVYLDHLMHQFSYRVQMITPLIGLAQETHILHICSDIVFSERYFMVCLTDGVSTRDDRSILNSPPF